MNNVSLIVYSTADLAKAKAFYATWLGTQPYADSPYYVGFKAGEVEIGLVPQSASTGPIAYATVKEINSALAELLATGAEKVQDVTDVANGLLVASVKNADGTIVGLRQFPNA